MTDQEEIGLAILQAVDGEYPESEAILSANIDNPAIPGILKGIKKARDRVQAQIRQVSRKAAPDVDGWIQQAKQLQVHIAQSKTTAREIVQQAEEVALLREQRLEVAKKAELLKAEVVFSSRLAHALENIRSITEKLSVAQQAVARGQALIALEQCRAVDSHMVELRFVENTNAVDLLSQRTEQTRDSLRKMAERRWNSLLHVDRSQGRVTILQTWQDTASSHDIDLEEVVQLSLQLDVLETNLARKSRELDAAVIRPCLDPGRDGQYAHLSIDDTSMYISGRNARPSAPDTLNSLILVVDFLNNNLPSVTSVALSEILMPSVISRLIFQWLTPSIPLSLDELPDFQILLRRVTLLSEHLSSIGWAGATALHEWVDQAPRVWLSKRRESSLASVRALLADRVKDVKVVERTETQMMTRDEAEGTQSVNEDDWDANWAEEEPLPPQSDRAEDEDEDVSAWDAEAHTTNGHTHAIAAPPAEPAATGEDEETDAWGWDDQAVGSTPSSPIAAHKMSLHFDRRLSQAAAKTSEREMTLKESYTVTAIPDEICRMIGQINQDADMLSQIEFSDSPIAPAASGLYSLPTLLLAGFRALAPAFYSPLDGGNMYLYNDSVRLASELTELLATGASRSSVSPPARPSKRLKLNADVDSLESFGKRAYGKEMESQRTILRDMLDGAQGFANCSEAPFAGECEFAVTMIVDRIRDVSKQWSNILSRSALLQSLGSLLSTVTSKMIADIEDLGDIGEAESRRLRHFCDQIGELSELFAQVNPAAPGKEKHDMTAVYTPNWFKFQYLSEILESSLADIKYLWMEGELKLEFEVDEVVDLIEALFAESDHRRRAIAEIRRI